MCGNSTRRDFLGKAAAATVGWTSGSLYAAKSPARPGPNETINLGLIGCGGEGRSLLVAHQQCSDARIVAVCDVHETHMAWARDLARGSKVLVFSDYRKLLENRDVDAVIIATNDHWHVLTTIHACQAGKDVYVEKPLGTSIGEGRAAVRAAREHRRIVQVGTQQRSWPHYQQAADIVRSGRLGEISEVKVWDYDYMYPGLLRCERSEGWRGCRIRSARVAGDIRRVLHEYLAPHVRRQERHSPPRSRGGCAAESAITCRNGFRVFCRLAGRTYG